MNSPVTGEVLFQYTQIGNSVRVTAVHADTGTEVIVQAPLSLSSHDMQQLALNKLRYVMNKQK